MMIHPDTIIAHTRQWISSVVIDLNLCPFARREWERDSIRYVNSDAEDESELLRTLAAELDLLSRDPAIETTFLIHHKALGHFPAYLDFLTTGDLLLEQLGFDGVFQIASFHPDYQFAGTLPDAAENYSNRSPYPMLHILREESVSAAVMAYPDTESIPARNIERLNREGAASMSRRLRDCQRVTSPALE